MGNFVAHPTKIQALTLQRIGSILCIVMRRKWIIIVLLLAIAGACGVYSCCKYGLREHYAENVDECPYFDIPEEAGNISYWTRALHPNHAYEFGISKEGFLKWARQNEFKVEEVTRPFEIPTYKSCKAYNTHEHRKIIDSGYKYDTHEEDRGFYVGYDSTEERTYVYFHTR